MKCKHCQKELQPINPPVEEYLEHKFCIKFFGWKLILLKDIIEMGCSDCLLEEEQSQKRDYFDEAVNCVISEEIEKGNLFQRR